MSRLIYNCAVKQLISAAIGSLMICLLWVILLNNTAAVKSRSQHIHVSNDEAPTFLKIFEEHAARQSG